MPKSDTKIYPSTKSFFFKQSLSLPPRNTLTNKSMQREFIPSSFLRRRMGNNFSVGGSTNSSLYCPNFLGDSRKPANRDLPFLGFALSNEWKEFPITVQRDRDLGKELTTFVMRKMKTSPCIYHVTGVGLTAFLVESTGKISFVTSILEPLGEGLRVFWKICQDFSE